MEHKVLSIQVPAQCPLRCSICRTPGHGEGDPQRVLDLASRLALSAEGSKRKYDEVYITSNGETGLSPIFGKLVQMCQEKGLPVSVLCATKVSVVPGLKRVEVSLNEGTKKTAPAAIAKAKHLGIPVAISVVDDGLMSINPEDLAREHDVDGVIVRALQLEGRSRKSAGRTQVYQRPGGDLGMFPASCYAELAGFGHASDCINHNGDAVSLLGGAAV